jgi:Type II intron maturase
LNNFFYIIYYHNKMTSVRRTKRLYAYFLREDLYATILQHTKMQLHSSISKTHRCLLFINWLKIKKSIHRMRNQKYTTILKQNTLFNEYEIILQIMHVVLGYIDKPMYSLCIEFLKQKLDQNNQNSISNMMTGVHKRKTYMYKLMCSNRNVSIHSAFLFLENRHHSCNYLLKDQIDDLIHPEIFIRIIRKYIFDICLVHLYRLMIYLNILHLKLYKQNFHFSFHLLISSIRNIYSIEIDNFFFNESLKICNQTQFYAIVASYDQSISKKYTLNEFHVSFKLIFNENILKTIIYLMSCNSKYTFNNIYCYKFGACHYLRCNSIWIFAMHINYYNKDLLKLRYIRFLTRRMGAFYFNFMLNLIYDISTNKKHTICLLGTLVKNDNMIVQIPTQTFSNVLPKTYLRIKYIRILTPSPLLIKVLHQYQFCTSTGYPLNRSNWALLNNIQIIHKFKTLQNSIIFYYSGCINLKSLLYIEQILRYSCVKTLAFKHKTTIRKILSTKTDKNIYILNVFNTNKHFWLSFKIKNIKWNLRIWHLELFNQYILIQDD